MTSSSAQRSSRSGRALVNKKEAPTRTNSTSIAPEESQDKETAKVFEGPPMPLVKSPSESKQEIKIEDGQQISAPSSSASSQPPSSQSNTESQTQPRRSMTRTRKPSSRLMPSPSPPPSRNSSSYHHHHSRPTSITKSTSSNSSISELVTAKMTQKKQVPAVSATLSPVIATSIVDSTTAIGESDEKEFGPGKRKRRPSTMTKPPSTITKQIPSQTLSHPTVSSTSSHSACVPLKVRINRIPSKSQTPEDKATKEKLNAARKTIKVEPSPHELSHLPSTVDKEKKSMAGYESDGNKEGARLMATAEPDGEQDRDEDSDAGHHQVLRPSRKIIIGRSKDGKEKMGIRKWSCTGSQGGKSTNNGNINILEPPPLISRRGGLKLHHGFTHAIQRFQKATSTENSNNHSRSHSTSVLDGKWAWTPDVITPTLRFRLACHNNDEDSSEVSDMEDEDDFHVAMLDGGDFGETLYRKAASLSSKDSHRDSKSGDDSDSEDTPATTPRSPQSTCDLPERRWSTGADDNEKENVRSARDAVFAHALESSSHRPHTHAGALTLSLPYQEMSQGIEDDVSERQQKKAVVDIIEEEDQDGDSAAILMSPAVHHGILGISSKQHDMILSSPQVSSAFSSPALVATSSIHPLKAEVIDPLTLPPLATANPEAPHQASPELVKFASVKTSQSIRDEEGRVTEGEEEAVEEIFTRSGMVEDSPENMCLTELDQAWEQNEHDHSTTEGIAEEEEVIAEAILLKEESHDNVEKEEEKGKKIVERTPKRGTKRVSIEVSPEEKEGKRLRSSPKSKIAVNTPSPARRSSRRSGVRV